LLHLHTPLRGEEALFAVEVGGEVYPFFTEAAAFREGVYLKAPRVRQEGTLEGHEAVEAAQAVYEALPGAKHEVVGIAQHQVRTEALQVIGADGFDTAKGAHRHKDGGFDGAMGGVEAASPGAGGGVLGEELKAKAPR
jgi:hypothetical protein